MAGPVIVPPFAVQSTDFFALPVGNRTPHSVRLVSNRSCSVRREGLD